MSNVIVVFTSFPDSDCAKSVGIAMVEEKLAACAQIGVSIESFYEWNGEFCRTPEISVTFKISPQKIVAAKKRFMELHPYECPEWVELSAEASQKYAEWVNKV